jgi:hypothetical protein
VFLGTSGPLLALSKTPYSGVSGLKAGQSRWVVCAGNPVNCVDPDGLSPNLGQITATSNPRDVKNVTWGQVMTAAAFAGGAYGVARVGIPAVYSLILRGQAPTVGGSALEVTGGLVLGGDLGSTSPTGVFINSAGKAAQITVEEAAQIQRFANKYSQRVVVVGSRAKSVETKAVSEISDFDFALPGSNSKMRRRGFEQLPRGPRNVEGGARTQKYPYGSGVDIMDGFDPNWVHVIFDPK